MAQNLISILKLWHFFLEENSQVLFEHEVNYCNGLKNILDYGRQIVDSIVSFLKVEPFWIFGIGQFIIHEGIVYIINIVKKRGAWNKLRPSQVTMIACMSSAYPALTQSMTKFL